MKCVALLLLVVLAPLASTANAATLFDDDPAHPWNRLYAALQGDAREQNPFKPGRRYFFPSDVQYRELVAALDAFIRRRAEKMIGAPVQRAVLQSLVWATFDQASDPAAPEQSRRDEVTRRCAIIIRRLALTRAQIAALPDNYAAAVRNGTFPAEYAADHRGADFLPPDLMDGKGLWVMIGGEWPDPAAVQHVRAVQGRSQFYVFIRVPGGRAASLEYLRRLANFPQPYVWNPAYTDYPYARSPVSRNPALPQFPQGTTFALLRLMILPDASGELRITPIAESLQMRVYTADPAQPTCCDALDQDFYEFRMDPGLLMQGKDGLRRETRAEFAAPLVFEWPSLFLGGGACNSCHGQPGVLSFNTYTRSFGPPRKTPWFEVSLPSTQDEETLEWKKHDYSWGLLRGLVRAQSAGR